MTNPKEESTRVVPRELPKLEFVYGEGIEVFWQSPYGNGRERIATMLWPAHPIEATAEVEAVYERIAKAWESVESQQATIESFEGAIKRLKAIVTRPVGSNADMLQDVRDLLAKTLAPECICPRDPRQGGEVNCPSCKSDFFPWRPCCYVMGDRERRDELLARAGLIVLDDDDTDKKNRS